MNNKQLVEKIGLIPEMDQQEYSKIQAKVFDVSICWKDHSKQDPDFPFIAISNSKTWKLRLNDFPQEEYLYTLFIADQAILSFNDFPKKWKFP